ncbi:HEAT repeat domain-containing protein [Calothrix sp. NIES-3974]|uniref:HEAT repeat domain-containing protein n=1 Tax=Calothrix sp. NIES-3974 TaxID=2005462 RepID=UPI000B60C696|nr:HEAT repeat domain-containing protein [Calothrix sp. NIES-3974]BAZ07822.1 HEAT domain-containing protein [Calothrix sp. NIES-3974]
MNNSQLCQTLVKAVEEADSSKTLLEAVQNLADASLEESVPTLIAALGYNNPGAAVAAVDGLVKIGKPAVTPLLELIDNYNYGARAWAVRALAGIGDPRGLETLLDAAKNDFALSVRRAAARGLGIIKWQELPLEEAKIAQQRAYEVLTVVCQDPEWVVRYAGVVGLERLAIAIFKVQGELVVKITSDLEKVMAEDEEVSLRTRAELALQTLRIESNQLNQNASRLRLNSQQSTKQEKEEDYAQRGEGRRN